MTAEKMMITKNNGEIVCHDYLRQRAASALSRFHRIWSLDARRKAIAETIDNDDWLRGKYGQTVCSVIRGVEYELD